MRLAALPLAALLLTGVAQPARAAKAEVIEALSVEEAGAMLESLGGRIQSLQSGPEAMALTAVFPGGLTVILDGMNCRRVRKAFACPEYRLSTTVDVGTPERAVDLAKQHATWFVDTDAHGSTVEFSRMGFTYHGVTRQHLREIVKTYLHIVREKSEEIARPARAD